jgi:hypothetical protein
VGISPAEYITRKAGAGMRMQGWESSEDNLSLRKQIDEYVREAVNGSVPQLPFSGYLAFIERGSRRESEAAYFERRKQMAAFCLYLQYHQKSESDYGKVSNYFQELLWAVVNEFTWCVMAHLPQVKSGFTENPGRQIDLFAAETAATLAEILSIHKAILPPFLQSQISNRVKEHILEPFLEKNWWWETVQSNWSAVCCGAIGMAALQLTRGNERSRLLRKVDKGLVHYLKSFGEDGACEEGIGYWVYGFGYYIYYIDMRKELDKKYQQKAEEKDKLKKISEFPRLVQMGENSFVPFSDVPARSLLPTGLLSYLQREFGVETPVCTQITPFDFDHCYRFAHISRNLWWTDYRIFHGELKDEAVYLSDRKWLLQRKKMCFFAVKGGHNLEQHNHNDVGSFVLALNGELFLADLGAGCYTADYFGEKRYEYVQTRSRYHNLPLVNEREQLAVAEECKVDQVTINEDCVGITMELGMLYPVPELTSLRRKVSSDMTKGEILLQDRVIAAEAISVEEGFISYLRPSQAEEGRIIIQGKQGIVTLFYEHTLYDLNLEELTFENHYGEKTVAYRIGLYRKVKKKDVTINLSFHFQRKIK